jgi:glycosyltransferase involved in cell wall biosynthesis
MAAGKPVVATDVGDVRELLGPADAGIVVEPENASALGTALTELLADPVRRRAMAARGRAAAWSRASPSVVAEQTLSVFRTVSRNG